MRVSAPTSATSRKILVSFGVGTLTFFITNELVPDGPETRLWGVTLSVFIAGVTLVTQTLVSFEGRLASAEDAAGKHADDMTDVVRAGFSKINEATELFGLVEASALRADTVIQLVRHSTRIGPSAPSLLSRFAQHEIARMSAFLKELSEGGYVTYEGEDRDWMLALARNVESTIDATSLSTVDAGGQGFVDGGLWSSDLGQRYLDEQRDAIHRGVRIRRVFIVDRPGIVEDPGFRAECELQRALGVNVRVLDASAMSGARRTSLFDFVLFDDLLSYEVTPETSIQGAARPTIVNTRLDLRPARVRDRMQRFSDLWASARELGT